VITTFSPSQYSTYLNAQNFVSTYLANPTKYTNDDIKAALQSTSGVSSAVSSSAVSYVNSIKSGASQMTSAISALNSAAKTSSASSTTAAATAAASVSSTATTTEAADETEATETTTALATTDPSVDALKKFAEGYNTMYKAAVENEGDTKATKLLTSMINTSKTYLPALLRAGVSFNEDGLMQVDEEKAAAAAENGTLDSLFGGNSSYGFGSRMERLANNVSRNTNQYVDKTSLTQSLTDALSTGLSSALSSLFSSDTSSLFSFLV